MSFWFLSALLSLGGCNRDEGSSSVCVSAGGKKDVCTRVRVRNAASLRKMRSVCFFILFRACVCILVYRAEATKKELKRVSETHTELLKSLVRFFAMYSNPAFFSFPFFSFFFFLLFCAPAQVRCIPRLHTTSMCHQSAILCPLTERHSKHRSCCWLGLRLRYGYHTTTDSQRPRRTTRKI